MGEIASCISKRSKLDSLLTDNERTQVLSIYDALPYDKDKSILLSKFQEFLQKTVTKMRYEHKLIEALWGDWRDVNSFLKGLAKSDREVTIDRLSFLHLWKCHGTSKRTGTGLCCTTQRQQVSASDYDEQSWRLSNIRKMLNKKNGGHCPDDLKNQPLV